MTGAIAAIPPGPNAFGAGITRLPLVLLMLWLSAGLPRRAAAAGPAHDYDVWPVEEGWSPSAVTSVLQSGDGYVWLGTYQGLERYDGVRFTLFDSMHTPGLQNSRITALYEDREGKLWIGHETGQLTVLTGGAFEAANPGPRWPGGAIEAITSDAYSDVWLLNDNGILYRLRDGEVLECPGGASPSRKAVLSRAKGGRLWVSANGSVTRLEEGKLAPFQFPDASAADFFERVAPARDGGLWVLENGRIRKWARERWEADLAAFAWGAAAVASVLETRAGGLLVGTLNSGLYLVRPGAETLHFSRTNGLSHDWVRSLAEDHEGNIWIGTGAGLDVLRPRKVKMLDAPDHWQGRMVLSIACQPDGTAWIGTEGAGLYRYNHGNWTSYVESSGLSNLFIWSVLYTRRDELYVGTWGGGLAVKKGEHFESPGDLAKISAPVVSMFEGREGEIWVGTTLGVYRFEGDRLTWSAGKGELVLPDVRAIAQTPDKTVWFGMSGGGLASLAGGVLKQYRRTDGLRSDFVMSLYAEADGTLWIGTADSGLRRWKEGKFAVVGAAQGLPGLMINQIADDGEGNLWLGSQQGILRVSKTNLRLCADGAAKTVQCLSYGRAEGLVANCSGGFQPSACKTPEGMLWFPTFKGIATMDPAKVVSNSVAPPVVIEQLLADGQALALKTGSAAERPAGQAPGLQVPAGKQRFEVRYTALSFAAPDKVRFRYKLEGLESEWLDNGGERDVQYSYLPPGSYTFRVMACNNDNVWNQEGAALAFTVLPHFWQTWWFYAAVSGAASALIAWGAWHASRLRMRRKLEAIQRRQAVEQERIRIAKDIHNHLGANLTRISLLSQAAHGALGNPAQATAQLDRIYDTTRELTGRWTKSFGRSTRITTRWTAWRIISAILRRITWVPSTSGADWMFRSNCRAGP